ncbi:uncharacterized protein LOC135366014 [Ornithodoros turicata]|uniref:uncharacterized protein LOC135366014 n=1 Tax=Ornithodoros turicata TaxID=34597 RepID=UPI0031394C7C
MEGRIPYDRIADVLIESFDNFGLHGKVTKVVTDNGSNFVKAFGVLGQTELAADGHMEDNDATTDSIDLTTILNGASHGDVRVPLPPHHRCSAHTLNLVATVDASKAESCEMSSRPLCSVLRTCRQLWNRQGQSATAAETVQRFCGRALQRPVATRWNSLFDALTCLMELDNAGKDLDGLCRTLQIPPFQRPRDVLFIKEYCEVMKPVACAIDVVQRDDVYFGHLLPTITVLKKRLDHLRMTGLKYCTPLVEALLEGIRSRFDHLYDDRDLLLAAVVIPRFKERWIDDEPRRRDLIEVLSEEVRRPWYSSSNTEGRYSSSEADKARPNQEDIEDYFSFAVPVVEDSGNEVVSRYLSCSSHASLSVLAGHPVIRKVFLTYNTALPSSAAVERVFSVAADILTRKRGKMTDKNFEIQLLLKLNRCVILTH